MIGAGKISGDWLSAARLNETECGTIEGWFCRAGNWKTVLIYGDGSVWVFDGLQGRWLTQDDIDKTLARIDAGV